MAEHSGDYQEDASSSKGLADPELAVEIEYAYPAKFKVIIHNDHYTAMDFVVEILVNFFHKDKKTAEQLMLTVHHEGQAVAGLYSREIAESKIRDIDKLAKEKEYPLRLSMEKA
ncbi:ATP-dependent Clp protease adapter protein ClpS [Spirochaetota bacterium]|nr:ATP-dependent Clp protease adapter protein ClpS [Spirochaetota bacterium]